MIVQQIESESKVVLRRIEEVSLERSYRSGRSMSVHQGEIILSSLPFNEFLEGCD